MKHVPLMSLGRAGLAALIAVATAATLTLAGCAQNDSSSSNGSENAALSSTGAVDENRVNAKTVIRAASDLFTMMDLGLTDADSGTTISMSDPAYKEFFSELQNFRDVADLDVSDASFTVSITAVEAATARGSQTNYRFTITEASVTVNGTTATYDKSGLTVA